MANFVLGAGKVYFKGKLLAETPSFSFSANTERVEEWTSDGPIAELAADIPVKVTREGKFSVKDINDYNLALFVIGSPSTVTTTVAAVTGDPINGGVALEADTYYQLGLAGKPYVGIRAIGSVALKTGGTTYTANTHYTLDATTGRIYVPTGSTMVGAICTADYSTTAASWGQVASSDTGAAEGELRFIADNSVGEDRDYLFPAAIVAPDGDAALKSRDTFQQLGFAFTIRKPSSTGAAVYINGRPA